MTTGILVGASPSPQFRFPRSYLKQLAIVGATNDVEQFGNEFVLWLDRSISYGVRIVFADFILPWSSNVYSLDHAVYDLWWFAFGDGVHHPDTFSVLWSHRGTPPIPTLSVVTSSASLHENFVHLDVSPPDWWSG